MYINLRTDKHNMENTINQKLRELFYQKLGQTSRLGCDQKSLNRKIKSKTYKSIIP